VLSRLNNHWPLSEYTNVMPISRVTINCMSSENIFLHMKSIPLREFVCYINPSSWPLNGMQLKYQEGFKMLSGVSYHIRKKL
jgi:hypothetical protein